MLRSSVSVVLIALLGLLNPCHALSAPQKGTGASATVMQPSATTLAEPTSFSSPDAKKCWESFRPQAPSTPAPGAIEACRRAGERDARSSRLLAVAYLNGQHGLARDKAEGIRLLETSIREANSNCRSPYADPTAFMYMALLLWNAEAWYNTDTFHEEPMNPGDRETIARRAIRQNQAKALLMCPRDASDPSLAQLARQMRTSMDNAPQEHYNPSRDGDSSNNFHAYQSAYANGGSVNTRDVAAAVVGATILLGLIGAVSSSGSPGAATSSDNCTIVYQTHYGWIPDNSANGGHMGTTTRPRPPGALCISTY